MDQAFEFLHTARGIVVGIIQLSLAISGMLCIWMAQHCWNAEGWGWRTVMTHHNAGEFDEARANAQQARNAFHFGWVVAGHGMIMLFLAGVIR